MKALKGILFLAGSILITVLAWYQAGQTNFIGPGLALTTLSLTFLLSTRAAFLEKWFYGIENMYLAHKIMAFFSLFLLFFHNVSMKSLWGNHLAGQFGNVAIYLFFAIVLVALVGKVLAYETWRIIHRFIFLAYILGLLHAYLILGKQLLSFNLMSVVTGFFSLIGIASGVYMILLYQHIAFKHWGRVEQVTRLNHNVIDLRLKLSQPLNYQFGQFSFLKIYQKGIESAPHPFSISGGQGKDIYFTIKVAGDHTKKLYDQLKVGSRVALDRAYGHLLLEEGGPEQVWIAGGVGVTPFLSYIREGAELPGQVHFYYAVSEETDAVHLETFKDYAKERPNFHLHLIQGRRLSVDELELSPNTHVFLCGPQKMMDSLAKGMKEKNKKIKITYESFSFK